VVSCNSSYITTLSDDPTILRCADCVLADIVAMERVTCTVCAVGANGARLAAVVDDNSMDSSILSVVSVC
jgi:hypothetical protein